MSDKYKYRFTQIIFCVALAASIFFLWLWFGLMGSGDESGLSGLASMLLFIFAVVPSLIATIVFGLEWHRHSKQYTSTQPESDVTPPTAPPNSPENPIPPDNTQNT